MKRLASLLLIVVPAAGALAAPPPASAPARGPEPLEILKGRPDVPDSELLGAPFESPAAGIALRPPANCKQIKRAGAPDEIIAYADEKRDWLFKVLRLTFSQPVPLTTCKDPATGAEQQGVTEITLQQLQKNISGAEVVRHDMTAAGDADVGMLALRYSVGTAHRLTQQAIIAANDQVYYVLDLTTPGAPPRSNATDNTDEKQAVATFSAILDTVKLLDRGKIKQDQDQRLYRTRALFVNWTESRLRSALVPEQYLRLVRDGKDIGYSYIVEETHKPDGTPGIEIGVRSRTMPEPGTQVDAESWMYVSFDRRHEDWSNVAHIEMKGEKTHQSDFGSSDRTNAYIVPKSDDQDGGAGAAEKGGIKLPPPVERAEAYTLNVTHVGKTGNGEPVTRDLPPFYLPQALGHLLPRIVPIREPKTFLFATYVADRREVMLRYVDVGAAADVILGGKKITAIPIADRIGLEGSVTYHYISPTTGKYLGSVNPDAKIEILPTDVATLTKLWKDAKLTRPEPAPMAPQGH